MLKRIVPVVKRGFTYGPNNRGIRRTSEYWLDDRRITVVPPVYHFQSIHVDSRQYAKGKDIRKDKKKPSYINEHELSELFDKEKLFGDINRPIDNFKRELIDNTTLRTSQGAIENVKITFEGETYSIQDIAEIGKKNPKLYVLDLSAFPQTVPVVMSTLQKSHMNINVQQDGTKIFVPIPKVTREYREVLAKKANVYFIKCKEHIREVQFKYTKKLKNDESLSSELRLRITDQLTALGDKHIKIAEEILKAKQDELLKTESAS